MMSSCIETKILDKEDKALIKTITVLNKKESNVRSLVYYNIQIYNGIDAVWYETDQKTYNSYKIGDNLSTLILQTTVYKKEP